MKRGGFQSIEIRLNICYTWEEEFSIERVLRRGESIMAISEEVRQRFAGEFEKFQKGIEGFFSKEIAPKDFKGIGGGFGSYAERGFESAMLRLRFFGSRILPYQMKFLVNAVKKYDLKYVHFTTGQCIQFHKLQGEQILELYKECFEHDIYNRGTGGDNLRNVTASPLHGVHPAEPFAVTPYLQAVSEYAVSLIGTLALPRKYKIGFSVVDNEGHANYKDLGFLAKENGKFDVYAGGGIGGGSAFGFLVDEDINPNEVLHHVEGMLHLYHELGDFKNRGKARSRFIAQRLGEEEFRKAYHEYLTKSKAAHDLTLSVEPYTVNKVGTTMPTTVLAEPQKQEGLYYIQYKPLVGTPPMDVFVKLFDYVGGLEETEIRICGDESVYIVNLTGEEADAVAAIISDTHAKNQFEHTVSCVGATICQIGFQDSSGLVKVIKDTLEAEGLSTDRLPQLHVSGCPSSCGTHQVGKLGFHGFTKVVDKTPQPAFKVFVNGNGEVEGQRMSDELGVITVEDIPKFFIDLVNTLEAAGQDYDTWNAAHPEGLQSVLAKYL